MFPFKDVWGNMIELNGHGQKHVHCRTVVGSVFHMKNSTSQYWRNARMIENFVKQLEL